MAAQGVVGAHRQTQADVILGERTALAERGYYLHAVITVHKIIRVYLVHNFGLCIFQLVYFITRVRV